MGPRVDNVENFWNEFNFILICFSFLTDLSKFCSHASSPQTNLLDSTQFRL